MHLIRTYSLQWPKVIGCLNVGLLLLALLLNFWAVQRLNSCSDASLVPDDRGFPRALHDSYTLLDIAKFRPMQFSAELGQPSVFKGTPRKELDDAWDKLTDLPMILVNNETLQAFDPTSKPTKGIDGYYYATVEVYHQLHCLDITRKFIFRDQYQHVNTFQDPPDMVWEHVDHCIDLLRQVLMCNADIGLIFYTDVGQRQPVARVSTTHMCRDFADITDWVNGHDSDLGIIP
ncbi:hypothetical protein NPX13_g5403 [Xylaria arbuscula]|uniref:Uncharacterized protein n=1 Tax=Xylaria arbuscula TaxID=114810 RepID=A0A9W8TLB7_9PEZI|nr:hypothetical protein NPX13_g5403 [Xylaria arbuscula]